MTDRRLIEDFLYLEAGFLDRADLDNWVSLFTEDGTYWMPASHDQPDPDNYVSHIYDDRVMMEIRKRNFVHPRASSKDWEIRCSHIIGNIQIDNCDEEGIFSVFSNQHVVVWYRDEQRIYAYRGTHLLVRSGESFLIRHKRVDLINPLAPQRSLTVYL